MLFRFSLLLLIVSAATFSLAQGFSLSNRDFASRAFLSGSVHDAVGHPISNARVDVQDLLTGQVVTVAYSSTNGSFQTDEIPRGQYEVIVTVGLVQTRSRLDLDMTRDLDFRLPTTQAMAQSGGRQTVSLSQMKVPGRARKFFDKALSAFRSAHLDDAFNLVQKALATCPDYAQALTLRGILSLQKGDTKSAQPDLEKAVELDYSDTTSFIALASLYNTEGKFDDAFKVLDHGMSMHPESWQGWMETARAQIGRRHYDDALKALARGDRYFPSDNTHIYLLRAQAFIGTRNYPAAISQLEAFLGKERSGPNVDIAQKTLAHLKTAVVQEAQK
jgi:predicted Zn-dependent protease